MSQESASDLDSFPSPRESGQFIAEHAKHVKLDETGIDAVVNVIYEATKKGKFGGTHFKNHILNPDFSDEKTLEWVFLVDTLNFCFWKPDDKVQYSVTLDGQTHTGYWSLIAVVNRALSEGVPITDASFYATVSLDTLRHVFRSDTAAEIPLLEERQHILNGAGQVLLSKFGGKFASCVKASGSSGRELMRLVFENFPSYRDVALFHGKPVSFLKRLQILVADVWLAFGGQGYGAFDDIDQLTAFADYRVPQVLLYYGALSYTQELTNRLKKGEVMVSGEEQEVEIRGCTIRAVEIISKRLHVLCDKTDLDRVPCHMFLIDNFLWEHRRERAREMNSVPYHKVLSHFY